MKCRKYWSSIPVWGKILVEIPHRSGCPVRDKISVEIEYPRNARRPVGTEYEGYCVPNGTPGVARVSIFYQILNTFYI